MIILQICKSFQTVTNYYCNMHPPGAKRILAISGSLRSGSSNHAILLFLGKIALLAKADGIIICTPEYAYGVPGSLKNALDWTISSGALVDKPVALITASTGGENTHAALLLILGALSANLLKDATLLIPFIRSKIDEDGNVEDEETAGSLKGGFNALLAVI